MATFIEHLDPDRLLSEMEAAKFLSVSHRTLQSWRVRGGGPCFVRLGRRVAYRRADLSAFIAENVAASTSEHDARRALWEARGKSESAANAG